MKRGIYKHYKGKEYELLYIGKHTETLEEMVVYRALYGDFEIWVRPASMWNESVNVNGEHKQRFELIKELVDSSQFYKKIKENIYE